MSPDVFISPNRLDSYITSICFSVLAISTPFKRPSLKIISPLPDNVLLNSLISCPLLPRDKSIFAIPKRSALPIKSFNNGSVSIPSSFD